MEQTRWKVLYQLKEKAYNARCHTLHQPHCRAIFTWYLGQCVKMSKKCAKKLDTLIVCYFCPSRQVSIILLSDNNRLKKVMLFLTIGKRYYVVGVHTVLPSGEGLFVINFNMHFTQGLWIVLVCPEKQFPLSQPMGKQIISALRKHTSAGYGASLEYCSANVHFDTANYLSSCTQPTSVSSMKISSCSYFIVLTGNFKKL